MKYVRDYKNKEILDILVIWGCFLKNLKLYAPVGGSLVYKGWMYSWVFKLQP